MRFSIGLPPGTSALQVRHPLENPRVSAPFSQHQQDCPGVRLTLLQHAGEATFGIGAADQGADFKVRGQARFHASQPVRPAA